MNMQIQIVLSLLVFLVTGCTSVELTKEEEQKIQDEVYSFSEQIIEPLIYLIGSTCIYEANEGELPDFESVPGKSSLFYDHEVMTGANDSHKYKFRLKSSSLFWGLALDFNPAKESGQCSFALDGGKLSNSSSFKFNGAFDISKEGEWKNSSASEIRDGAHKIASFLYFPYMLVEQAKPYSAPNEYNLFRSSLGVIILEAGLCVLLDIDPNQCHRG